MKQLVILCAATNFVGHVNAVTGATLPLLRRGHKLVFVLEKAFAGTRSPLGYIEHTYTACEGLDLVENPGELMATFLLHEKVIGPYSAREKMSNTIRFLYSAANQSEFTRFNSALAEAIEKYKPDLIYFDSGALNPAIAYSGIPWIKNVSVNPLFFTLDPELPPGGSGLPSDDSREWAAFNALRQELFASETFSKCFLEDQGYAPYPGDLLCPETQLLTVYSFPEELNYSGIRKKGWFNLEVFNQLNHSTDIVPLETLVPGKFLADTLDGRWSGKLIYLSMGSMGSIELNLMKRLLEMLSQTPHKYIVSKGPRALEYGLTRNMTGERYVNQIRLLPHVDLVIAHGGNNTLCEAFAEGKPLLLLPQFSDQFDNGQRVAETDFGLTLDPYGCTQAQLVGAIDCLLNNRKLQEKMKQVSRRIRQNDRHEELADTIEELIQSRK